MRVFDLAEKLGKIEEYWQPRLLAELNGQELRLAKLLGEFCWHSHEDADELFLVVSGTLRIDFRDRSLELGPGQLLVIPKGVEHRPVAEEEVAVLLCEPKGTDSGGGTGDPRSVSEPEAI